MTTLQNGDRKIDVTFGSTTIETKTIPSKKNVYTIKENVYTITLPTITCNNEQDAKTIESTVNKFVSNLVKEILSKEN